VVTAPGALDLAGTGLDEGWVADLVERTLTEDLTGGPPLPHEPDLAVAPGRHQRATVPAAQVGTADLVARATGVVAGCRWPPRLHPAGPGRHAHRRADGDRVAAATCC
jgi:nicotinate-nucleotide pyrophosphorylase (carboxylating)